MASIYTIYTMAMLVITIGYPLFTHGYHVIIGWTIHEAWKNCGASKMPRLGHPCGGRSGRMRGASCGGRRFWENISMEYAWNMEEWADLFSRFHPSNENQIIL